MQELLRQATSAQLSNVEVEVLNQQRIKELYPVVKDEDLVGGVYMPKDGQADPVGVTNVLANTLVTVSYTHLTLPTRLMV